ncbi:MAG: hypothetical protein ACNA7J_13605, partial [Wenzhouxiangella sp.]
AAILEQRTIPMHLTPRLALIIVYLGVAPAAIGFSLWNAGVKKLSTGGAMVFYNEPFALRTTNEPAIN